MSDEPALAEMIPARGSRPLPSTVLAGGSGGRPDRRRAGIAPIGGVLATDRAAVAGFGRVCQAQCLGAGLISMQA
ncbi:MAG: hypothetical protein M0Z53_03270 [Thermaerobacter sp.]|nr:hypothetical protein [Thermaerobacter sp.]